MKKLNLKIISIIITISFVITPFYNSHNTSAISGSDFKAGRIIDDSIFVNKNTMSAAQIQQFLNAKVPACEVWHSAYNSSNPPPYTCLKDYQENPTNGDNNFGRYTGSTPYQVPGGKSAAQIIWEAGQAYGINPQVLIVLLQKEQGLVTDTWPLRSQYTKAMGYLCPDTAPCSASAGGFYKQVFGAAWQFRNDFNGIDTPGFWSPYGKGWNNILYNPSSSCGTKSVFIENQATAVLYKYTPYTPNNAALNNLYGLGDSCSAYGNRNFWRYFNDWFGSSRSIGYEFVDAINPPSQILPNDVVGAVIRIKNVSGSTWYSDGNVPPGQYPTRLSTLSYQNTPYANVADPAWLGTHNQIKMKEQTVPDGAIATFEFTFKSPLNQVTTYWTQFAPVIDGIGFMPYIGMSFITSTPAPNYSYMVIQKNNLPSIMPTNSIQQSSYLLKNTGNVVWWGENNRMIGAAPTRIYTTNPPYHPSIYYDPTTWLSSNQIKLQADRIDPGANGLFSFNIKSPNNSGTYSESFGLVLDGRVIYPQDQQMQFTTKVTNYIFELVSTDLPTTMIPGQKYDCKIIVKNTGSATWYSDGNNPIGENPVRLINNGYKQHYLYNSGDFSWINNSQIKMFNSIVQPNQNAEFRFSFIAPYSLNASQIYNNFNIVVDGKEMLSGNIYSNTYIPNLIPSYQHVPAGIHPSPVAMQKGQISNGKLILKNTSNFIWYNEDSKPSSINKGTVRLVMSFPYYRNSAFANPSDTSWLGTSNQIKMASAVVYPGENAEFDYTWKAPTMSGVYKERFSLVMDGVLLFTDIGMQIDSTVN